MHPIWAQRQKNMLNDCLISPDVFTLIMERLDAFVVPYQQALETEADQHPMHLYLQGLLSHLPGKNAEDIATFVNVERQVIQDFIGTVPWDHRPLVAVLVGQGAERLGEPDGALSQTLLRRSWRGSCPLSVGRLSGQGVEQFGRSEALFSNLHPHLSFLDHVHEFYPDQCVLGCRKRFESQHRSCDPLRSISRGL